MIREIDPNGLSDSEWRACLFLLGELPGDEAREFAQQLADDAQAQHSVVEMSRLIAAVKHLPHPAPAMLPAERRSSSTQRWIAPSLAAASLVLAAFTGIWAAQQMPHDASDAAELLQGWSQQSIVDDEANDRGELEVLLAQNEPTEIAVPSWMWVAVELEYGGTSEGEPVLEN